VVFALEPGEQLRNLAADAADVLTRRYPPVDPRSARPPQVASDSRQLRTIRLRQGAPGDAIPPMGTLDLVIELPDTWCVPILRSDFTDDDLWAQLQHEITSPTKEGFLAGVDFVESPALTGLSEPDVARAVPRRYPRGYRHPVLFVADALTVSVQDHPLLVLNLSERAPGEPFRTTPRQVQSIENNLSISNMDFIEFAQAVDPDGVFRGF